MRAHMPSATLWPLLRDVAGVRSGVSCRPVDAADPVSGRAWVARAAGVAADRVAMLRQVHGSSIVTVPWEGLPEIVEGDGMVTGTPGFALSVRVADCAPVALATADGRFAGLAHAGWRGVAAGGIASAVATLCGLAGQPPENIRAAVGPCIGLCCYEVGEAFQDRFEGGVLHRREGRLFLDLPGAVAVELEKAGVPPDLIDMEGAICTVCGRGGSGEVSFHSHRGSGGLAGRNVAFVVLEGAS